ncbi:MAG: SprB repeat-containing protein, partial [Bacteroidota bacterium]
MEKINTIKRFLKLVFLVTLLTGVIINKALAQSPTTGNYSVCSNGSVVGGLTSTKGFVGTPVPNFTGNTTGAPTITRGSCSAASNLYNYRTHTFTAPVSGLYTFNMCASGTTWDSYLYLYNASSVSQSDACSNIISQDDDACGNAGFSKISNVSLIGGNVYTLLVTSYGINQSGAYTITTTTPDGVEWYTAPSGGSVIARTSPFNPVGVAGSGITNTSTLGTTTFYAQFLGGTSRTAADFTINGLPTVSITNPSAVCSPSTIDLTASAVTAGSTGGLTYTYWTNNTATNSYATPAAAANGAYFIKGTDANSCYAISGVSATVNPLATITNTTKAAYNGLDLTCYGTGDGQITVTASGGTGTLQYSKDNGTNFQLSNVFSGLSANTYQIKVKDVNTCTTTATTVSIDAPVVVSFSTSKTSYNGVDLSCHNGADGQITVTPVGGSGSYSYSKNNGSTWQVSNVFSGLTAGTYLIKVKDANNCTPSAQSVTINNPTVLSLGTISNNGTICENFALTLASSATGGTGLYSYAWTGPLSYASSSQNPTVSSNATSAMSGTYNIVITDVNGCRVNSSTNATVNEMPHLVSNASPVTNTICEGISTTITCTNAGSGVGSPSYTSLYSNNFNTALGTGWSFPATNPVTATPAIKSWNGGSVLGNMGAQQAILNLTNIPSHDFITVDFDLYIHDSWDGNNTSSGPDVFNMIVNGDTSIHTTFSNWNFAPYNTQAYPSNIPASNPNFTGALATNLPTACNSSVSTLSTKYHITKTIAHTAS